MISYPQIVSKNIEPFPTLSSVAMSTCVKGHIVINRNIICTVDENTVLVGVYNEIIRDKGGTNTRNMKVDWIATFLST